MGCNGGEWWIFSPHACTRVRTTTGCFKWTARPERGGLAGGGHAAILGATSTVRRRTEVLLPGVPYRQIPGRRCRRMGGAEDGRHFKMSTVRLVDPGHDAEARPSFRYHPHNLSVAVDVAVTHLAGKDSVYRQNGHLVVAQRTEDGVALHELTRALARSSLTECMVFIGAVGKKGEVGPIIPPNEVIDAALSKRDSWHAAGVRACSGISRLPGCHADGSLIQPGYDAASRRLVDFNGATFPRPGETKADAAAALGRVSDLLIDFPFATPLDRAVAVSLLITAVHRSLMRVCPAYLLDSPSPEIGKSLIVDLASALITGKRAQTINPTSDQNEMRKSIFSMLISGSQHIAIDNIDLSFGGAAFDILVTQETYPDRVLGVSEMRAPSSVALVTLTGRNVKFLGDGALRTLRSRLETLSERPGLGGAPRKHPRVFHYVIEKRHQLVSDCVTIARAYLLAGRPNPTELREFDDWCMRVREPMIWLGMEDVADTIERQRLEGDATVSAMVELMRAWVNLYGDRAMILPSMVSELRTAMSGPDRPKQERLSHAIEVFAGVEPSQRGCARVLGGKLAPNVGRPMHGMILRQLARHEDGNRWQVVSLDAKPAPPDAKPVPTEDLFEWDDKPMTKGTRP